MLLLQLRAGEYMTIGDDVLVQVNDVSGDRCKLMIQAPREIPVIRGELLERAGAKRPECVAEPPRRHQSELSSGEARDMELALTSFLPADEPVEIIARS